MFTGRGGDIWSGTAELLALLNGVAPTTISQLRTAATTMALPARRVIYKPGDRSNCLYVVLSGRVKLTLPIPESKPRIVTLLGPGAWFGETALLLRERHAIGAETAEAVMLARISSATVIRLLHADNVFALKMLTETSRRLRASMLDTTSRSSQARDRVISYLLDEIDPSNEKRGAATLTLPAVKRVIASRLGMAGETLSRVFRELSRENLISVDGPHVSVKSVSRLRAAHSHNSS
jgi:CRP/FNR family transcriptional regulator, dissimilatory nitrate respiration regulator